jgi:hypothetical protein
MREDKLPFVRAAGSPRVVASAANWSAGLLSTVFHVWHFYETWVPGFAAASHHKFKAKVDLVLPEMVSTSLPCLRIISS